MFMELKHIADLRSSELAQVTTPFYAVGQLKNARAGYVRIRGFETAWESYTDHHGPFDWNHRERGFERLRQAVEQGGWVLVLDKSWPPISPAYQQVNGQWEATPQVWSATLRQRLRSRVQNLEREQREMEVLQSRNAPPATQQTEPATGPGHRTATLGPHAGSETTYKSDEKTAGSGAGPTAPKPATSKPQATVDGAISSIKGSSLATTEEGKKVISKIEALNASGKIKYESMSPSTRGKWSGSEIVVNANFSGDVDATASELVHEATHALHEDEFPASKTKITIDEEMRTNENQLALYEDQRKGGFRDPELEQRRNDQAKGKLRDNVRRRYPGTPEHL